MQLKKIKVYGTLRKFLGQSYFEAAVKSPREAFKFLTCNFPKLERHMNNQIYKIKMNGVIIYQDNFDLNGDGDIQIIPVAIGSEPLTAAVAGIASLFAGSAVTTAAAKATTGFLAKELIFGATVGQLLGGALTLIGTNLVTTGVSQMLTPTPDFNQNDDPEKSFASQSFSGIENTAVSGIPKPIIYGEVFTGSIVISASTDVQQFQSS